MPKEKDIIEVQNNEKPPKAKPGQEVVTETASVPAVNNGFMHIIEKMASIPSAESVDSLERMMKMQMEWEDRQDDKEFSACLARLISKLSHIRIIKNKKVAYDIDKNDKSKGQKEAFRYTTIEDIERIVRPMLIDEDITPSYTCKPSGVAGMYDVTCILTKGRHRRESSIPLPMDTSGGKNNAQGMGSTFAYGKRYALCAALFITTVGEDNDGNGAPITEEQAIEIKSGLKETGLDVKKFLKTLGVDSVEEIQSKQRLRAMTAINAAKYEQLPDNVKKEKKNANPS